LKLFSRFSILLLSIICIFTALPANGLAQGRSIAELQRSSHEGSPIAQNLLALKYFKGNGVTQDSSNAARLFRLAAKQGLKKAQFNLAYMYHNGIGLPQDYTLACVWYKAAADQGHSEARKALNKLLQYTNSTTMEEIDHQYSYITHNPQS